MALIDTVGGFRYLPIALHSKNLTSFVRALDESRNEGGAKARAFRILNEDGITLATNAASDGLAVLHVAATALGEMFEGMPILTHPDTVRFHDSSKASFRESMQAVLLGGQHELFDASTDTAAGLVDSALKALEGPNVAYLESTDAWSDWFHRAGWDHTWLALNTTESLLTIITTTDND